MKDRQRWSILVILVLAGIAVALDHVSHRQPEPATAEIYPLADQGVETGGYGSVSDEAFEDMETE